MYRLVCFVGIFFLIQPVEGDVFSPISGRGYYRDDGSFVIARDRLNPGDVTVVSDRFNVYHKRVYRYVNDPLVRSVLGDTSILKEEGGEFRDSNSIRRDYVGRVGKYEG